MEESFRSELDAFQRESLSSPTFTEVGLPEHVNRYRYMGSTMSALQTLQRTSFYVPDNLCNHIHVDIIRPQKSFFAGIYEIVQSEHRRI